MDTQTRMDLKRGHGKRTVTRFLGFLARELMAQNQVLISPEFPPSVLMLTPKFVLLKTDSKAFKMGHLWFCIQIRR